MKIKPGQMKKLHLFLNMIPNLSKEAKQDLKKDLVRHYSGGKDSVKDLDYYQANQVINHLKSIVEEPAPLDPADVMRKKIISMLREIGYEKFLPQYGRRVADMSRIYQLIKEKGYLKPKPFNDYTYEELPKLVSQIENIYLSTLKSR